MQAAYSRMKEDLEKEGVIFVGSIEGLKEYPEIFKSGFGKVIPTSDNKFSALNSAVFLAVALFIFRRRLN